MISIIIPVYNAECYLKRCLDSVIAQDYLDVEVILADDGSTDKSGQVCDEYAKAYPHVYVFHKSNEGASLARRYGLEKARGEYVTFVDSDDWISSDYISKLYSLIEKYKVSVSACSIQRVKIHDNVGKVNKEYLSSLLPFDVLMPRFFKYEFWGFPGKLYLTTCLRDFDFPNATLSEDYYVMAQLFNKERQMAYTEEPLYYYEYHENSLSHQKLSKRAFEEFANVKAVYDYSCQNMPEYADYALSNVVETCVKLFTLSKSGFDREQYKLEYSFVSFFLRKNAIQVIRCKPLNYKIKILALIYTLKNLFF